jgi:molybdopterin-guanine dinucleotide biosynthesis protein A
MGKYRRPRINFVLDEDIRDDLTVWAKEEGRTMSNLVERIVTAAVQGKRKGDPNQNPLIQQEQAGKGGTS